MLLREIALQLPEVKSPSQRELAAKLETSQQLISHHLRRLENQGLIARKRSGLRTRRVLTEEGQRIWAKLAIPA
jgi:DNA-binding MarR family transcriptional regulator